MAEFKAQLLGILIVVAVFGVLLGAYKLMAEKTIGSVSSQVSSVLNSN